MEFDIMCTRSKQPLYCSRIMDTRRTVFSEADGAHRMPLLGVLQTTGSGGCLTVYSAVGKTFTLPMMFFTPQRCVALVAHLRDVAFVPRAPQPHRVVGLRRGSGTGHEPKDQDDADQARGGAEALSRHREEGAFGRWHFVSAK